MSVPRTIDLHIHGMTCGACVSRVERALRSVPDVRDASVNLLSESARAVVGESSPAALIDAIRAAGYDAEIVSAAAPRDAAADPRRRELLRRSRQAVIIAAGLALPIVALDHVGHGLQATHAAGEFGWRLLQGCLMVLLLAGPAGAPVLVGGLRAIARRSGHMDVLISLGVGVAFVSSVYGTFALRPEFIHFHAAAVILLLVAVGRWLEAGARGQTSEAVAALARRAPREALVRRGSELATVPAGELRAGDEITVPPHHAIPADGVVLEGTAEVDESLLTGEPLPARRGPGDAVRGGALVQDGTLVLRATRTGASATIGRILRLVDEVQAGRTELQRLADRVAGVMTPIIVLVAAGVFASWLMIGGRGALAGATRAAVATLVVACPCAMGLATPTAIAVAAGAAALRGILARDAAALEALGRVDTVVWDKTGTLTAGRMSVAEVESLDAAFSTTELVSLAGSAELFSSHPIGRAIVEAARRGGATLREPDRFESLPGAGVVAEVDGRRVIVGGRRLMELHGVEVNTGARRPGEQSVAGQSVALVALDGRLVGLVMLRDELRPSAAEAVRRLAEQGIRSVLLTGDARAPAEATAARLGISEVRAEASPFDKVEFVRSLRAQGRRVAMVGDGINDAAALAAADVGVAFATGADVAVEAAGLNLVGSTPHLVADAVALARATTRVIRQNLAWAFGYNAVMVPLAATGTLPPALAAGAMMASSLTVVLNALRLRRIGLRQARRAAGAAVTMGGGA